MKTYAEEIEIFEAYNHLRGSVPTLSAEERLELQSFLTLLRAERSKSGWRVFLIEAIPFIACALIWAALIFILPSMIHNSIAFALVFGVAHGFLGYSYVVYTLHLGAGHRLFGEGWLRRLAFHSSRLLFADPLQYREAHLRHHRSLGQKEDGAFTHYVLPARIIKSMLPGAGVLFPNDYKIHHGETYTLSRLQSDLIGLSFLGFEVWIVSPYHAWYWTVLALAFVAPWIGSILDRTRESIEHQLMPSDNQYGTREFGMNFWGLLWGGGPWGQPCHFSHHFAPDLNWLDQIRLHRYFRKTLRPEMLEYFGFEAAPCPMFVLKRIWIAIQIHRSREEVAYERV